ncbi:MAG: response regulator, partial [Clostridiales bacterium]|nr:response regulator [Clostridiales bacterium]
MKRILLVDDDFLSLNAFYALTDWNRIGVQIAYEAHNGREALEYMEKTEAKPDAAFIDVCMPDMDGIVLLQTSVYKGYKQDKIEMRGDRAEMSDFPLYLNTVA